MFCLPLNRGPMSKVQLCNTDCRMLQHSCRLCRDCLPRVLHFLSISWLWLLCSVSKFADKKFPYSGSSLPLNVLSQILLDPYAKLVKGRAVFGKRDAFEQYKTKARGWRPVGSCRTLRWTCSWCRTLWRVMHLGHSPANRRNHTASLILPLHDSLPAGGQRVPRHL